MKFIATPKPNATLRLRPELPAETVPEESNASTGLNDAKSMIQSEILGILYLRGIAAVAVVFDQTRQQF